MFEPHKKLILNKICHYTDGFFNKYFRPSVNRLILKIDRVPGSSLLSNRNNELVTSHLRLNKQICYDLWDPATPKLGNTGLVAMEKHVRTFLHDCEKKCFPVDCWDAKIGNAQKIPSQEKKKKTNSAMKFIERTIILCKLYILKVNTSQYYK